MNGRLSASGNDDPTGLCEDDTLMDVMAKIAGTKKSKTTTRPKEEEEKMKVRRATGLKQTASSRLAGTGVSVHAEPQAIDLTSSSDDDGADEDDRGDTASQWEWESDDDKEPHDHGQPVPSTSTADGSDIDQSALRVASLVLDLQAQAEECERLAWRQRWIKKVRAVVKGVRLVLRSLLSIVIPLLLLAVGLLIGCGLAPGLLQLRQSLGTDVHWEQLKAAVDPHTETVQAWWAGPAAQMNETAVSAASQSVQPTLANFTNTSLALRLVDTN